MAERNTEDEVSSEEEMSVGEGELRSDVERSVEEDTNQLEEETGLAVDLAVEEDLTRMSQSSVASTSLREDACVVQDAPSLMISHAGDKQP